MKIFPLRIKCIVTAFLISISSLIQYLALSYYFIATQATPWLYNRVEEIPFNAVGVVLGTRPGGPWFNNRIAAAAQLYQQGKVKWLIVSGDNKRASYNEPWEMQKSLVAAGVPSSAIYCDYAGFTTLDSVIRARDVFGQSGITIISQKFHNQRAVWLARENDIAAIGINADDVPVENQRSLGIIREYVARGRAILDVKLWHRRPHFLGPAIVPGSASAGQCKA